MHQADGLVGGPAAGTGDAGDGDGKLGRRAGERPFGHGLGDLGADGAVGLDEIRRNAEKLGLGGVRIGDEAAFEDVGRAGDFGQRGGDQAAGAGLGGTDAQARRLAGPDDPFSQLD